MPALDSRAEDLVLPEFEDVILELETAGNPLTVSEIRELLDLTSLTGQGRVQWRDYWRDGHRFPGTVKIDGKSENFQFKFRKSRTGESSVPWRFSLQRVSRTVEVVVGGVGLVHGFGLLVGKPGRSSSLTADRSLCMPRPGLRLWPYPHSGSAISGVGVRKTGRLFKVEALAGRFSPGRKASAAASRMLRVSLADPSNPLDLAVLVVSNGQRQGVSIATRSEEGPLSWASEMVMGRATTGGSLAQAAMLWLRFSCTEVYKVEAALGWSKGGPPTDQSTRPGLLVGWGGKGTALRVTVHPVRGNSLKILIGNSGTDQAMAPDDLYKGVVDFQWEWTPMAHWRCRLRRRREAKHEVAWSQRYPWLPPVPTVPDVVATTVASVTRNMDQARFQLDFRSRETWGDESGESRYLIAGKMEWNSWHNCRLRVQWGLAWGGGGDLVSAVSPMRGYVVPRHWGHWQQEWMVGVGREFHAWRIQAGMAKRDPVPLPTPSPNRIDAWCEVSWSW